MTHLSLQHAGRPRPAGDFRGHGDCRRSFGELVEVRTRQQQQEIREQREDKGGSGTTEQDDSVGAK